MPMGYRGNPNWRDMSEYLVHQTTSKKEILAICESRTIRASGPFGLLHNHPSRPESQKSCCLSEIPLDHLSRLVDQHGSFGLVFEKEYVASKDGQRVQYLNKDSLTQQRVFEHIRDRHWRGGLTIDEDDPILAIAPFTDHLTENRQFEWEREWRVVGGLDFSPGDVRYIFAPEHAHADLSQDLAALADAGGPDFTAVPIVDPLWDEARLQGSL